MSAVIMAPSAVVSFAAATAVRAGVLGRSRPAFPSCDDEMAEHSLAFVAVQLAAQEECALRPRSERRRLCCRSQVQVDAFRPEEVLPSFHTLFLLMLGLRPGSDAGEAKAILNAFTDRWFYSWTPPGMGPQHLYAALLAPSFAEVEALRREAETIPTVVRAETLVPVEMRASPRWLDARIAEEAGRTRRKPTHPEQPRPTNVESVQQIEKRRGTRRGPV